MKKIFVLASVLLLFVPALVAQAVLTNDSIVKLSKAGLSDGVILSSMNNSPGDFDVSPDGLVALKTAGVSDRVIAAMVQKSAKAAPQAQPVSAAPPRVFLDAQNAAHSWGAQLHNQAAEMSKDFGEECPAVQVTVNQQAADYIITLNHVQAGFYRDNQLQASTRSGDVVAPPVRFESIAKGVKRACGAILADWSSKQQRAAQ